MRFFLELAYKGSSFNGWQRQPNAPSVQEHIENALSTMLREQTSIVGAGRTDTGVHASYYVCHFDSQSQLPESGDFTYHLNAILAKDIAIMSCTPVSDDAHARFDAVSREYKYHIINSKNPFRQDTAWLYSRHLDTDAMNEAAKHLLDAEDFTTFSKLHSNNKTYVCSVSEARWSETASGLIFTIRADRFLRNMVRSIVGTLFDVGRGSKTPDQFAQILKSCDRSRASGSAPAAGLFLNDIAYPSQIFERTSGTHF